MELQRKGYRFMKKILVTGGSGFVGSHIVEALRSRGLQATVLTRHHGNNNGKKGEVILGPVIKLATG
jgi:nucleoside-diphosphate-sugar epimerase